MTTAAGSGDAEIQRSLGRIESKIDGHGERLEVLSHALFGNGQPGVIQRLTTLEAQSDGGGESWRITIQGYAGKAFLGGVLLLSVKLLIYAYSHHWPNIP